MENGTEEGLASVHPQASRTYWSGYENHMKQAKKDHNKEHSLSERRSDDRLEFDEEEHHQDAIEAGVKKVFDKHVASHQ